MLMKIKKISWLGESEYTGCVLVEGFAMCEIFYIQHELDRGLYILRSILDELIDADDGLSFGRLELAHKKAQEIWDKFITGCIK